MECGYFIYRISCSIHRNCEDPAKVVKAVPGIDWGICLSLLMKVDEFHP